MDGRDGCDPVVCRSGLPEAARESSLRGSWSGGMSWKREREHELELLRESDVAWVGAVVEPSGGKNVGKRDVLP